MLEVKHAMLESVGVDARLGLPDDGVPHSAWASTSSGSFPKEASGEASFLLGCKAARAATAKNVDHDFLLYVNQSVMPMVMM
jgi:hypothetical protein